VGVRTAAGAFVPAAFSTVRNSCEIGELRASADPEELDYSRCLRFLGRFRFAPVEWDGAHHLIGGHPSFQSACGTVFEGPLGPECNVDPLFAAGRHGGAVMANLGVMYDPEIDLRFDPPRAGSQSVTNGDF